MLKKLRDIPNIFFDSDIFISSYLYQRENFYQSLISYAKSSLVNLYISDVVYFELIKNFKEKLEEEIKKLENCIRRINKITTEKINTSIRTLIYYQKKYEKELQLLIENKIINKIDFNKNKLDEVMERYKNGIRPFSGNKQEFKDCMIWLTYRDYIDKNKLSNCYFLSKNTSDFYNDKEDDLHPHLKKELPHLKIYKEISELYVDDENFKRILEIGKKDKIRSKLKKLYNSIREDNTLKKVIPRELGFDIEFILMNFINNLNPRIILNQHISGDFEFLGIEDFFIEKKDLHVQIIEDFCYISCSIRTLANVVLRDSLTPYNKVPKGGEKITIPLKFILSFTKKPDEDAKFVNIKDLEITN